MQTASLGRKVVPLLVGLTGVAAALNMQWTTKVAGLKKPLEYSLEWCRRDIIDGTVRASVTCRAYVKYNGFEQPTVTFEHKKTWAVDADGTKHPPVWSAATIDKKVMNNGKDSRSRIVLPPNSASLMYFNFEYPLDAKVFTKLVFDGKELQNVPIE